MNGGKLDKALARMEAALARLEAAAQRHETGDAALEARHERLRAAVGQSLRQLDDLIAGRQG